VIQSYIYFAHYTDFFADPRNRTIYFLGWFEGETVRYWANSILATLGTTRESPLLNDWTALLAQAALLWGPINEEQTARDNLRKIRQTESISDYHARFSRWSLLSNYNEEALADAFYRGLKAPIKDMMVNIQRPLTVEGLLRVSLDFESRILTRTQERRYEENRPRFGKPANIKATKLSPEERAKRMREGRCFICNQTGHMSRTCPRKPAQEKINKAKKEEESDDEEKGFQNGQGE
jgi:hypothetical protein